MNLLVAASLPQAKVTGVSLHLLHILVNGSLGRRSVHPIFNNNTRVSCVVLLRSSPVTSGKGGSNDLVSLKTTTFFI